MILKRGGVRGGGSPAEEGVGARVGRPPSLVADWGRRDLKSKQPSLGVSVELRGKRGVAPRGAAASGRRRG